MLTWQRAQRALGVHLGLNGDDSFPFGAPALGAQGPHAEGIGVVGQKVLHYHRRLARVGDAYLVHLAWEGPEPISESLTDFCCPGIHSIRWV